MRYTLMMAVAALVVATPAIAEEWDFILTNQSGKEIKLIELAPTGTTTWQKNKAEEGIRRTETLANAARMTVHFERENNQCRFDIRATFADDTTAVWANVNVCDDSYITLRYRNGAPVATGD